MSRIESAKFDSERKRHNELEKFGYTLKDRERNSKPHSFQYSNSNQKNVHLSRAHRYT